MSYKALILSVVAIFSLNSSVLGVCPVPECAESSATDHDEPLHAHTDPYKFWQCAPSAVGFWEPVEKDCALGGIVFSASAQQCVWLKDWDQTCQDQPRRTTAGTPKPPTPTPTPTPTPEPEPIGCCKSIDCTSSNVAQLPACPCTNTEYKEYYRECVNGVEVIQHCPHKPGAEQLLFNYFIQSCVHPKKWEEACVESCQAPKAFVHY